MSNSSDPSAKPRAQKNWAGNFAFSAQRWLVPENIEALQKIIAKEEKIRAVGTKHSFSRVADSNQSLVSLEHFNTIKEIDRENLTVTVGAGIRYGELAQTLDNEGYALHNLASLVHIGVAGACATATHGSGIQNGNLATAVCGMEIVNAKGELVQYDREKYPDIFDGLVVHLGALGIVTKLKLRIEPAFQVQQTIYEALPFAALASHFMDIMSAAYSVSLFTDWAGDTINQVWLKHRMAGGTVRAFSGDFFGARPANEKLHPVLGFPSESCTDQMGLPGPWHDRLQHFRLDFTPSAGDELQSELLLPLENAVQALHAIKPLAPQITPVLYTSEIRTVASDSFWLSTAYKQPSVCIHFTWKADWAGVRPVLQEIEQRLTPFGARPHWGKISTLQPAYIQAQYPMLDAFRALRETLDPTRKFENAYVFELFDV